MSAPIRVGVIGAGVAARQHLEAYQKNPNAQVVAIFDADPERAGQTARDFGVEAANSLEELAALRLDAVSLATPHATHLPIFELIASQVGAVLMEKPLEITLERARSVERLALRHGVKLMMSFVHRYRDEVRAAFDAIRSNEIGTVGNLLESLCSRGGSHPPRWVFDRAVSGGGALMYTGVHSLDRLRWLAGREVVRVSALTRNLSSPEHGVEDALSAIFEFEGGAIGTLFENAPSHQFPGGWTSEVYGSKGAIRIRQQHDCVIGAGSGQRTVPAGGDRFAGAIDDFVSCLIDGKPFSSGLRDGMLNAALADAVYRSASSQQTVRVEDV